MKSIMVFFVMPRIICRKEKYCLVFVTAYELRLKFVFFFFAVFFRCYVSRLHFLRFIEANSNHSNNNNKMCIVRLSNEAGILLHATHHTLYLVVYYLMTRTPINQTHSTAYASHNNNNHNTYIRCMHRAYQILLSFFVFGLCAEL